MHGSITGNVLNGQMHRDRTQMSGCHVLGEEGMGTDYLLGTGLVPWVVMKTFWDWREMTVA